MANEEKPDDDSQVDQFKLSFPGGGFSASGPSTYKLYMGLVIAVVILAIGVAIKNVLTAGG